MKEEKEEVCEAIEGETKEEEKQTEKSVGDKEARNEEPVLLYLDSFGLLDKKYANIIRM